MTKICTVEGCGRKHRGRGFCNRHLLRLQRHGDPLVTLRERRECSVDGCTRRHRAHGLCNAHGLRLARRGVLTPSPDVVPEWSARERAAVLDLPESRSGRALSGSVADLALSLGRSVPALVQMRRKCKRLQRRT